MDIASQFSARAWQGAASGGILALTVGLVVMPASIMMNANIHHHPVLRIIMGVIGGFLSIFTVIYAMIFMRDRHYYGLFPLVSVSIPESPERYIDWPYWLFKNLSSILLIGCSIFRRGNTQEDTAAFVEQIKGLFENAKGPFVKEDLLAGARAAASATDQTVWQNVMSKLEPIAKGIYKGPEAKAQIGN